MQISIPEFGKTFKNIFKSSPNEDEIQKHCSISIFIFLGRCKCQDVRKCADFVLLPAFRKILLPNFQFEEFVSIQKGV